MPSRITSKSSIPARTCSYVPVTQLDLLSRYTAPGDERKGQAGQAGRRRVAAHPEPGCKKATEEMAQELIDLYARRRQAKGYAFPARRRLAAAILRPALSTTRPTTSCNATAEIKKDMEKPYPMDRLLCGDVGVGKTEVALRAAFKCVMGGKQCAILAPTTLLAWQHYNTILSRMEAFPVKVGLLSRFRTAKQQKETLRGLQAGSVDIVVGTHRLLAQGREVPRPGPCHHRRGAALRRQAQGEAEGEFHRRGYADPLGHPHPPHPEHGHERHPGHVHHRAAAL